MLSNMIFAGFRGVLLNTLPILFVIADLLLVTGRLRASPEHGIGMAIALLKGTLRKPSMRRSIHRSRRST